MLILVFALFSVDIREQIGKKGIEIKEKAWLLCAVMGLKVFPAPRYHLFVMKMASSTYFFVLNSKMASKNTLGHSLMTQNAPSRLYPVYQI